MSRLQILENIQNGYIYETVSYPFEKTLKENAVYRLYFETPDTNTITINVLKSDIPPLIKVYFYKYENNNLKKTTTHTYQQWNNTLNKEFPIGEYYIEIETNCEILLRINQFGFQPYTQLKFNIGIGARVSLDLKTKKREQECNEALHYELIDGELPPGIELQSNGLLIGKVSEIDCIDNTHSPSFNWYFDNHDGQVQSFGRRWRFKVRVRLVNQWDTFVDEWLCVRVYNNWTLDQQYFQIGEDTVISEEYIHTVNKPVLPEHCPPIFNDNIDIQVTPFTEQDIHCDSSTINTNKKTYLPRYNRVLDCVPCYDPTTPTKREEFNLPKGLSIRTPDELLRYYTENQNNFEPLIMELHTSKLFQEFIDKCENKDKREVFEMNISNNVITLIKYFLTDNSSLDSTNAMIIANRNITGNKNPLDIVVYHGERVEGVLIW